MDLDAQRPPLDADPIRFQQVLWNLIKNAIKFTPPGGQVTIALPRPTLHAGNGAAATRGLVIEVSDTGIGIDADALPGSSTITEQGGISAATRRFGGLGLGLTISRSIVEQHGGRLTAASPGAGHGATFTVEMPTVPAPAIAPPTDRPSLRTTARASALTGRPLRILLVDDNQDTLNVPLEDPAAARLRRAHGSDMASALRSRPKPTSTC